MTTRRVTNVLAVFGAIAVVGLIGGTIVAALAIHHGFSARDQPSWLEGKLARAMRGWAVPGAAKRLANPVPVTPEILAEAKEHWADHCATCHANDGSGTTPMGQHLYPKAPDMRATATQSLSDGELHYIIQNGIRLTGMPAWGEAGDNDHGSWALVAFIRHLPKMSSAELQGMKEMNPRSSREWREQEEERRFLEGELPQKQEEQEKPSQHH